MRSVCGSAMTLTNLIGSRGYIRSRVGTDKEDVTTARERLTQCSTIGSPSVTFVVSDERALFVEAARCFDRGRAFGLGSEATRGSSSSSDLCQPQSPLCLLI